jgi:hypothetical protein
MFKELVATKRPTKTPKNNILILALKSLYASSEELSIGLNHASKLT